MRDTIETSEVAVGGATYRIAIHPDPDAANPLDTGTYGRILSLGRRHSNFDPGGVAAALRSDPDAVALAYYEHGDGLWAVAGELPALCRDRWDSVAVAGCWLPGPDELVEARNYGGRTRRLFMEKRARQACRVYTTWANGHYVGYTVERVSRCDHCGREVVEPVDSCWGFDDIDYARECARAAAG